MSGPIYNNTGNSDSLWSFAKRLLGLNNTGSNGAMCGKAENTVHKKQDADGQVALDAGVDSKADSKSDSKVDAQDQGADRPKDFIPPDLRRDIGRDIQTDIKPDVLPPDQMLPDLSCVAQPTITLTLDKYDQSASKNVDATKYPGSILPTIDWPCVWDISDGDPTTFTPKSGCGKFTLENQDTSGTGKLGTAKLEKAPTPINQQGYSLDTTTSPALYFQLCNKANFSNVAGNSLEIEYWIEKSGHERASHVEIKDGKYWHRMLFMPEYIKQDPANPPSFKSLFYPSNYPTTKLDKNKVRFARLDWKGQDVKLLVNDILAINAPNRLYSSDSTNIFCIGDKNAANTAKIYLFSVKYSNSGQAKYDTPFEYYSQAYKYSDKASNRTVTLTTAWGKAAVLYRYGPNQNPSTWSPLTPFVSATNCSGNTCQLTSGPGTNTYIQLKIVAPAGPARVDKVELNYDVCQ